MIKITINQSLLAANQAKAAEIRSLLKQKKILMLNLISSPGSGKTTLLAKTLGVLKDKYRMAVIEGDIATDRDARRLEAYGVPISLINTDGACHLEAISIEKALQVFDLHALDLIFVENVGNLVCPAEFDIGENLKVAMLSVPEGDDKLSKYPLLFREAKLLLLNKIDLRSGSDFNSDSFYNDLQSLNANLPVIELSCKSEVGFDKWLEWLEEKLQVKRNERK